MRYTKKAFCSEHILLSLQVQRTPSKHPELVFSTEPSNIALVGLCMNVHPRMNLEAMCRVCLDMQVHNDMVAIFGSNGEETAVSLKIGQCSAIELMHGSNMPEYICSACVDELEMAFEFRIKCQNSDAILKSFVETAELVVDNQHPKIETRSEEDCIKPGLPIASDLPATKTMAKVVASNGRNEPESPERIVQLNEYFEYIAIDAQGHVKESSDRQITEHHIIEGVEYDENNRSLLKVNVMGNDQYVEYRVNVADVDLLRDGNFKLVQNVDHDNVSNRFSELSSTAVPAVVVCHSDDLIEEETSSIADPSIEDDCFIVENEQTYELTQEMRGADIKTDISTTNRTSVVNAPKPDQTTNGKHCDIRPVKKQYNRSSVGNPTVDSRGKASKPKVCEICGNQYRYQHALDGHMRRHRNEKPFECKVCGKGFVINFELSRHMRTHTGHKPYACSYCDQRFADFGCRVKHERTHTGERPYQCQVCFKWFAYSHVLTNHMLTHTGIKRYSCDKCDKRFTKAHHLKSHKTTHDRVRPLRGSSAARPSAHGLKLVMNADGSIIDGTINGEAQSSTAVAIIMNEHYMVEMSDVDEDEKAAVQLTHYNNTIDT